ncbi:LAR-like protein [Mya arenaria]|uniref:LAR-like protein n=1 Tax=Mya arenaria TaxID=6604 RepID=A0ABY7F463_MYAAR|nr:LAR-like protein [Mya arenaria]
MKQMGDEDINGQFQEMQNVLGKTSDNEMHAVEEKRGIKGNIRPSPDIPETKCRIRSVTHFEFNAWDYTSDVPKSSKDYLDLIKSVDSTLRETSNRGPVLVHCLDGSGKSALFCVVSILLEKMDIYQEVSVVNTIRKVRSRRKSAIPSKEQFEFCHECVLSYVKSFEYSQYANFTTKSMVFLDKKWYSNVDVKPRFEMQVNGSVPAGNTGNEKQSTIVTKLYVHTSAESPGCIEAKLKNQCYA